MTQPGYEALADRYAAMFSAPTSHLSNATPLLPWWKESTRQVSL